MKRSLASQFLSSVLVNSVYAMVNYPVVLVNTLLAPLSMLLVITFATHGALLPIASEGALIMAMVSSGTAMQGDLSHLKNDMRIQDMVVSSPTSAWKYLSGMATSQLVYSSPTLLLLSIIALVYLHMSILGGLMFFADLVTVFMFSMSLGFFLSTLSSDIVESWSFSGLISPLLSTLPPVYYPISYIPYPFRYAAYLSPTTYSALIAQHLAGFGGNEVPLAFDWLILIATTLVIMLISVRKSKWRE